MQILKTMVAAGPDLYYQTKFRNVLEDHMTYLREHPDNHIVTINPAIAYAYAGDLFGALRRSGVPEYLHWVVMRMNHMTSRTDYRADMLAVTVPPESVIAQLSAAYRTQNTLKK